MIFFFDANFPEPLAKAVQIITAPKKRQYTVLVHDDLFPRGTTDVFWIEELARRDPPKPIVVGGDGAIYFSDPTYGRMEHYGLPRPQQLDFQGIYRIDPASGAVQLLARDFGQPNGLCFSLDGRELYVNDTDRGHIRKFAVRADGTLEGGAVWAETKGDGAGAPDGMKIDSLGNVWCCGPGGIHVFNREARCLGVVRTPEYVANFCWGDADYRSLFVTASTSLYRIRTEVT